MKHIADITNLAFLDSAREEKIEKNTLDPACSQLVDQVFIKFALLCREYDALYADAERENAEKLQWTLAFTKHNLKTKSHIQHALNQTEKHKWGRPPQLGQFLEWCKPSLESLGFPSPLEAHAISIQMNAQFSIYKHEDKRIDLVIRHVIRQIGSFQYRTMSAIDSKKAFEAYYAIATRDYLNGNLKDIDKMMEDKTHVTEEVEKQDNIVMPEYRSLGREESLAAMKKLLGSK